MPPRRAAFRARVTYATGVVRTEGGFAGLRQADDYARTALADGCLQAEVVCMGVPGIGTGQVVVVWEDISQALAERRLMMNQDDRAVDRYARSMSEGRFLFAGDETLRVDHHDIRDGQHRLAVPYVPPESLLAVIDEYRGSDERAVRTVLTPELAQELLDRYAPSRPLSARQVDLLVYQIRHPDPEGSMFEMISVAPDGSVIAGQHLLNAVLQAGESVGIVVVLNRRIQR